MSALVLENGGDWIEHDPLESINVIKRGLLSEGRPIIDLSMINPDIEPPRYILDRLVEATLKTSNHRYAVSRGIRKLRAAFSEKYKKVFGIDLDAETEVCAVMGTKDALIHIFDAHLNAGDRVLIGAPTYPLYLSSARIARLECSFFPVSRDQDAMLSSITAALEDPAIRMIILNFPNNPTGISVSREFYQQLSEIISDRDIIIFNDLCYGEMCFEELHAQSLLSVDALRDRAVECYSMSKAYSVPGWRVGAVVGSPRLVRRLARLKSHLDYGLPLPIQHAAAAALTADSQMVRDIVERYEARLRALEAGLTRIGWEIASPDGGVCLWAKIPERFQGEGSLRFAERLLIERAVQITPGFVYGKAYDHWARFAAVAPQDTILEVVHRLSMVAPLSADKEGGRGVSPVVH